MIDNNQIIFSHEQMAQEICSLRAFKDGFHEAIAKNVELNKERQLLIDALTRLLKFNEELCQDVNVSTNYPSAVFAREVLAKIT